MGGIMQIHITRACDKSCFGCTQGSNLGGKPVMMTPEQFEFACQSLDTYFGVVGIFGGNPCINPHFEEICKIMQRCIPKKRRGLWSNNLMGKGAIARETFNPAHSNLNVHLDKAAYDEFQRDWPEAKPFGLHDDSRHFSPFIALRDVITDEAERWRLIGNCDINAHWSAMICTFRGELRGFFCEIAGAQAMLHQNDPSYPDTGLKIEPGWWDQPMAAFDAQVRKHCHECSVPLRGRGELAIGGSKEQVSKTHLPIYKPKSRGRAVEVIGELQQIERMETVRTTEYVGKAK
jgi:hypothetical protein